MLYIRYTYESAQQFQKINLLCFRSSEIFHRLQRLSAIKVQCHLHNQGLVLDHLTILSILGLINVI